MENEFDGTLFFKGEGKKRKLYLKFTTRNQKTWENPIGENILSPSLKEFAKEEKKETEKTVKLQEQGGRPIAVYLEGETIVNKAEIIPADYTKTSSVPSSERTKFSKPRNFKSKKSKENRADMKNEFHNPYNFVPIISRTEFNKTDKDGNVSDLGDKPPCGHNRYISNKFSGKLTVKMTVETPLVVLDTAKMSINTNDKTHKEFPVRVSPLINENGEIVIDNEGQIVFVPHINPTAVKGMLRSAYEAVTNSRMSVFSKHKDRLAFRAEVQEGLFVIPARIEGEKGKEKIVFYTGKSEIETDGGPKITRKADKERHISEIRESQYAAWIRMYEKNDFETVNGKNVFKPNNLSPKDDANKYPKHPKKAYAWIEEFDHGRFKYWKVIEIAYNQANLSASLSKSQNAISSPERVEGYICNTGKTMKSKHDERFFFGRNSTYDIDLEQHHIDYWNKLIKDYRKQHDSDFDSPPKEKIKKHRDRSKNGKEYSLEWSRHIQRTTKEETAEKANVIAEELKDGTLCYARVKQTANTFEVLELYPVMISRRLHKVSPDEMLDDSLKPATDINELSPADRVFGWVGKGISKNGSYRGQVRFGSVVLTEESANKPIDDVIKKFGDENNPDSWLSLNILGQPKPQQGRFYVARNKSGDAQVDGLNNENAGYNLPFVKGLRGRKVYPHHANLPDDYWTIQNNVREYLRPDGEQGSQNRSIQGWIEPKTEFQFDIHFTNLSKTELGALIWLLDLPDKHFHRFGGGKPYGFGSVKLEIIKSDVREGKDLKTFYMSLDDEKIGKLDENSVKKFGEDFKELAVSAFPTIVESFLRACKGFSDKPTHYPRKTEELNEDTKSFEWFVANNKIEKGTVKNGYVLQDLAADEGLPYLS